MSYRAWIDDVDHIVIRETGVSMHDLADYPYSDAYRDGMRPAEVASELLAENGWTGDDRWYARHDGWAS